MLTLTLETQHRAMQLVVADIHAAMASKDLPALKERLARLQGLLMAHVGLEHAQFYPRLVELAGGDEHLERTVKLFKDNMELIATGLASFFKRHVKGELDVEAFSREWPGILRTLTERLLAEEQTLHPIFERLTRAAEKRAAS